MEYLIKKDKFTIGNEYIFDVTLFKIIFFILNFLQQSLNNNLNSLSSISLISFSYPRYFNSKFNS